MTIKNHMPLVPLAADIAKAIQASCSARGLSTTRRSGEVVLAEKEGKIVIRVRKLRWSSKVIELSNFVATPMFESADFPDATAVLNYHNWYSDDDSERAWLTAYWNFTRDVHARSLVVDGSLEVVWKSVFRGSPDDMLGCLYTPNLRPHGLDWMVLEPSDIGVVAALVSQKIPYLVKQIGPVLSAWEEYRRRHR